MPAATAWILSALFLLTIALLVPLWIACTRGRVMRGALIGRGDQTICGPQVRVRVWQAAEIASCLPLRAPPERRKVSFVEFTPPVGLGALRVFTTPGPEPDASATSPLTTRSGVRRPDLPD